MMITRRELIQLVRGCLNEGKEASIGSVEAKLVDGGVSLNGERYELHVGFRYGPRINITDITEEGDTVVVAGHGMGRELKAPLSPAAIKIIQDRVGDERFTVPGRLVSVSFVKSTV
jgi:hypothetical protein